MLVNLFSSFDKGVIEKRVWTYAHTAWNTASLEWLHGQNVDKVVTAVGALRAQCVLATRVQPSGFVGNLEVRGSGLAS